MGKDEKKDVLNPPVHTYEPQTDIIMPTCAEVAGDTDWARQRKISDALENSTAVRHVQANPERRAVFTGQKRANGHTHTSISTRQGLSEELRHVGNDEIL